MFNIIRQNFRICFLAFLFVLSIFVWSYAYAVGENNHLIVAFLDVGQGDAIFIQAPNGNQILLDAGPNGKVLEELGKIMPFYDRTIDMIMVSNPDADHIGGFLDVLDRFEVEKVVEPGTLPDTNVYKEFGKAVLEENSEKIIAKRGMKFILDDGAELFVLFPDRDVSDSKTNDGSLIMKLTYGNQSFLFTGDAPSGVENYLVRIDGKNLDSDVLKVAHHGSKYSSSNMFLSAVSPEFSVISVGAKNKYGHPTEETLDRLEKSGTEIFRTDLNGTIIMETDGDRIFVK